MSQNFPLFFPKLKKNVKIIKRFLKVKKKKNLKHKNHSVRWLGEKQNKTKQEASQCVNPCLNHLPI